jgi:pyruvate/2-oxoglutarate dehydrogenase complex dihydrolipoamide acyltransferase (E2) component
MIDFNPDNHWRRVAAAIYKKPTDSKIFGSVELDVTDLEAFIQEKRKEGLKITLTHMFTLLVARGLREAVPELNCYIRRGKPKYRPHVEAAVSVLIKNGSEMGSVKVPHADTISLSELTEILNREVPKARQGDEKNKTMRMKAVVAAIPWPFRSLTLRILRFLSIDLGLSIPALGIGPDSFGSFILSNIGTLGLDMGYPALLPSSNVAFVLIMGGVHEKPAVVDGQIVPRRIISLGAALDHRVVDATHGGRLFLYLKQAIKTPERLLQPAE